MKLANVQNDFKDHKNEGKQYFQSKITGDIETSELDVTAKFEENYYGLITRVTSNGMD